MKTNRIIRLLTACILIQLFSGTPVFAQSPAEFYVSNDAASLDSSERQFLTLAQAQSRSNPGDTIYLVNLDPSTVLDASIQLKPGQKLLGVDSDGRLLENPSERIRLSNSSSSLGGAIVRLADHNEIAGVHFVNMRNAAIAGEGVDYSGAYLHHNSFTGNAEEHIEDERGLVYAVSFDANVGELTDIRLEHSEFNDGEDLGAIRVFQSGNSRGSYRFQDNHFSDLGGRPYFVRTQNTSRVETVILDSSADNIGRGDRNSDSIIPYLMGQSEQIMLVRNYHFKNTLGVGNQSNTGIEAYMFGFPREDEANFCTGCKLTFKIEDSVIENAITDPIQFSNGGRNSQLHLEIRNTRIIGGTPRQGGGGISLNLQSVGDSGSHTTLLVENTEIIGTDGYGFAMNNGGGGDYSAIIDLGGGSLGSAGNNLFRANERGDMRLSGSRVHAINNSFKDEAPSVFNSDNEPSGNATVIID
ncbi:MAG: DUF1565 domain-containing protein [Pseudomonadales bacterium]|nr:DUF1565 domain-containing protein [Pseudomonadales bacterium]